jgi:hypothetical protein
MLQNNAYDILIWIKYILNKYVSVPQYTNDANCEILINCIEHDTYDSKNQNIHKACHYSKHRR